MKFKKVEISAFRIYDDPNDATFDLTSNSGRPAGFVSLFAPNGFGKTSFYDAVEYGMTGSIDRFYLRAPELEKLANLQSLDKFIRNSSSERATFVRLYTDRSENSVIETLFNKHGKQKHDLNFDPKKRKEHPFQKVILSQEWISAFLTESNGEYRYKKFMEIPELSSVNDYYLNLKNLLSAYWKKDGDLNKEISQQKEKIQSTGSDNLLDTLNNQIAMLQEKYGEATLKKITITATKEEVIKFKDTISSRIISSNRENVLREMLDNLSIAKAGNDALFGVAGFFKALSNQEEVAQRLSSNKILIEKLELSEKLNVTLDNTLKNRQDALRSKEETTNILSIFNEYEMLLATIQGKNNLKIKTENTLAELGRHLEDLNRTEIDNRSLLEVTIKKLEELNVKRVKLPTTKAELERLNGQIEEFDKKLIELRVKIENEEKILAGIEIDISNVNAVVEKIHSGVYPQITSDDNAEISVLIRKLLQKEEELLNDKEQRKSIESTIEQQQELNNTVVEFIKAGLAIVDEQKSSNCPLCDHAYDSYSALVEKITSNNALDNTLKILLIQKNALDVQIFELLSVIKNGRDNLIVFFAQQIEKLSAKKRDAEQLLTLIRTDIENFEVNRDKEMQKRENHNIELGGISVSEFENQLDKNILDASAIRDETTSLLLEINEQIDKFKEQELTARKQMELLQKEVEDFKSKKQYIQVVSWFSENFPDQEIVMALLTEKETSLTDGIKQMIELQNDVEDRIRDLNNELVAFNKEGLVLERTELEKTISDNQIKITAYQYFLKDKLEIDHLNLDEAQLSKILEDKQADYRLRLATVVSLLDEYKKLEKYSENILPFLQSENAKLELERLEAESSFLSEKVKPLIEQEREKVKIYLNERVKNFFYEGLINDLYKKIDPHPEFKYIEFRANFDTDTPRLDVFVRNNKNEDSLIPNLYFSTAQINILSLSIFLAAAINSKEYQCIFIDDPIQSMDSINVLSTIDLLRSIVVNEGKQIILSTHDENFHNLLKKKMPPDLFESRFLELESFGKVKQSQHKL